MIVKFKEKIAGAMNQVVKYVPKWLTCLVPNAVKEKWIQSTWELSSHVSTISKEALTELRKPVLIISIPKCGTYLLRSVILAIPGARLASTLNYYDEFLSLDETYEAIKRDLAHAKAGDVFASHLCYDKRIETWLNQQGIQRVFIYRDPRDSTVSSFHDLSSPERNKHLYGGAEKFRQKQDGLMECIRGIGDGQREAKHSKESLPNVGLKFGQFLGWMDDPKTASIRYEDLVPGEGESFSAEMRAHIQAMLNYLNVCDAKLSAEDLEAFICHAKDPKQSLSFRFPTFREGKSGGWKRAYTSEHKKAFQEISGDLLIKLGYERDDTWLKD